MKPRDLKITISVEPVKPAKLAKPSLSEKSALVKALEKELTRKVIPDKPARGLPDKLIYVGPDDPDETGRIEIGKGGGKGRAVPGTINIRLPKDRRNIP